MFQTQGLKAAAQHVEDKLKELKKDPIDENGYPLSCASRARSQGEFCCRIVQGLVERPSSKAKCDSSMLPQVGGLPTEYYYRE